VLDLFAFLHSMTLAAASEKALAVAGEHEYYYHSVHGLSDADHLYIFQQIYNSTFYHNTTQAFKNY
jgi:hypothetical protein